VENRDALDEEIGAVFGSLSGEEAIESLAQIANARLRTVRDFLDHPQFVTAGARWDLRSALCGHCYPR
jgi:crotonobetainyl-CoA:carnitine CoA-transferase CaiB-like acyl-CoA transferase